MIDPQNKQTLVPGKTEESSGKQFVTGLLKTLLWAAASYVIPFVAAAAVLFWYVLNARW